MIAHQENMLGKMALTAATVWMVAMHLPSSWPAEPAASGKKVDASHVEPIAGSKLNRVQLTQKAADRLDIKVAKTEVDASGAISVPYAAVLYDVKGNTWVYTNVEPLVYVRHPIQIHAIDGSRAILEAGPPAGTSVVVVGGAELFGAESGVGH